MYHWKGNLMASKIQFKYWKNILISWLYCWSSVVQIQIKYFVFSIDIIGFIWIYRSRLIFSRKRILREICIKSHLNHCNNDLLIRLLGPYWEIRSPMFFVRSELAKAVRESEGFVFLVRTG